MEDLCNNCGAKNNSPPTPSAYGGMDRVCIYCGHRNHVAAPPPPAVSSFGMGPIVNPGVFIRQPTKGAGWVVLLAVAPAIFTAAIVGVVAFRSTSHAVGAGSPVFATPSNEPRWDTVGDPPAIVTVGGSEAVVGRLRSVGDSDALWVGLIDATTTKSKWRVGPFGTYSQGYRATHVAVVGQHVVVSDFHAAAHVYALDTGKEERVATLTDMVSTLCSVPPNQVWLQTVDKRSATMDVTTGKVTEAPAPAGCSTYESSFFGQTNPPKDAPKIAGFDADNELEADSTSVLLGKKSPGTATPMVVGLDKKTRTMRWKAFLPAVDLATVREDSSSASKMFAVSGDRIVGAYGAGEKAWHVTALDAASGARQWDTVLKPIFAVDELNGVKVSTKHVYVVRMESIDVLDAATGKITGTIGSETYESDVPH